MSDNMNTTSGSSAPGTTDDFYVGYLPTPKSHTSMLRVIVPAVLLGLAGVASVVAYVQRNPGSGMWSSDVEKVVGVILSRPAPMLLVESQAGQQAMLLVEEGKHGAGERAAELHEKRVEVSGTRLSREGRTVFEIATGTGSVKVLSGDDTRSEVAVTDMSVASADAASVTLRGEIIDSKCYHGAMKPGDGKSHKACATLCVSNGIPAMFAAVNPDGTTSYYLLAMKGTSKSPADVSQFDADTLSKIGELVEVQGTVSRVADLNVLTIEAGSVRRVQ